MLSQNTQLHPYKPIQGSSSLQEFSDKNIFKGPPLFFYLYVFVSVHACEACTMMPVSVRRQLDGTGNSFSSFTMSIFGMELKVFIKGGISLLSNTHFMFLFYVFYFPVSSFVFAYLLTCLNLVLVWLYLLGIWLHSVVWIILLLCNPGWSQVHGNLPASTFLSAGIAGMSQRTCINYFFIKNLIKYKLC